MDNGAMQDTYIGFNPCFNGYSTLTIRHGAFSQYWKCFNPCFNGYSTLTKMKMHWTTFMRTSFNPCFNGYSTLTDQKGGSIEQLWQRVSILVLMDTLL